MVRGSATAFVAAFSLAISLSARAQTCTAHWTENLGYPGVRGHVYDMIEWDDGSGTALYIAGDFTLAGSARSECIARWDGTAWTSLGSGVGDGFTSNIVSALAIHDGALYAAGHLTTGAGAAGNGIVRWDGAQWTAVGGGVPPSEPEYYYSDGRVAAALAVFGGELYCGMREPFNTFLSPLGRWDGLSWRSVPGCPFGYFAYVAAMVTDDSALYGFLAISCG